MPINIWNTIKSFQSLINIAGLLTGVSTNELEQTTIKDVYKVCDELPLKPNKRCSA